MSLPTQQQDAFGRLHNYGVKSMYGAEITSIKAWVSSQARARLSMLPCCRMALLLPSLPGPVATREAEENKMKIKKKKILKKNFLNI